MIRNAIQMIIDGHIEYDSGYNQGIKDAIKIIRTDTPAMSVSIAGTIIGESLIDLIYELEKE